MKGQSEVMIFVLLFAIGLMIFIIAVFWSWSIFHQNMDMAKVAGAENFMRKLNDEILNLIKYGGSTSLDYNLDGTIELVNGKGGYTKIYDFVGITYPSDTHKMWEGCAITEALPLPEDVGYGEEDCYLVISAPNGVCFHTCGGTGINREWHKFRFLVDEPSSTVNNLTVFWRGIVSYGTVSPCEPTIDSSALYIWNFNTASWELVDFHSSSSAQYVIKSFISNINYYINSEGYIYLIASTLTSDPRCSAISSDFVKVEISTLPSPYNIIEFKTSVNIELPKYWVNLTPTDTSSFGDEYVKGLPSIREMLDGNLFKIQLTYPTREYYSGELQLGELKVELFTEGPRVAKPDIIKIEKNSTSVYNDVVVTKIKITFI